MDDRRQFRPVVERNREPILEVLKLELPDEGLLLEVASGSGEHAMYFAEHLPRLTIQPSDPDAEARASIDSWREHLGLVNVRPALDLDVTRLPWPLERADAVLCINMVHISPWRCTEALMRGAAGVLDEGAPLLTYGPYRRGGRHTAPSNAAFDESLRARNPAWGVRDLEQVQAEAEKNGLKLADVVAMPANNFTLVFRKA